MLKNRIMTDLLDPKFIHFKKHIFTIFYPTPCAIYTLFN